MAVGRQMQQAFAALGLRLACAAPVALALAEIPAGAGHARQRPGQGEAGCDPAGVGEAALGGHAAAALEDDHLVAVGRQFVGRADAGDAGADDGDAHVQCSVANAASACSARSSRTSSWPAVLHSIRPTGNWPPAWPGREIAQPSSRLTTAGLRSSSALAAKKASSLSSSGCSSGATTGTVGLITASN